MTLSSADYDTSASAAMSYECLLRVKTVKRLSWRGIVKHIKTSMFNNTNQGVLILCCIKK